MSHISSVQPFLKWVGGKRQLLPEIQKRIPTDFDTYFEPFIGGGAVLFNLQVPKALINDLNEDLINVYQVIKNEPDALIEDLATHRNEEAYYYKIRALDRSPHYAQLSTVKKASRIIFLNKTCFNGLYRVNRRGYFNTPFGKYKNPNIVNENTIRAVHLYLNQNKIKILNTDFEEVLSQAKKGDFVYLDPPYAPLSSSANFTAYVKSGFHPETQKRLRDCCIEMDQRGVKFLLSNSATPIIEELYADFRKDKVQAKRAINSVGSKRGAVEELMIRNY